jgi:hypothetical protein
MKIIINNYKPDVYPKMIQCENCKSILEIEQSDLDPDNELLCVCCGSWTSPKNVVKKPFIVPTSSPEPT